MELTGTSFLYTLAGLTITFAGFSALLLGIRQAAGGQSSSLDRYLAKTGLTQLFTLAAAALLPALLSLYGVPEMWLWRVSAVLFAVPTLSLLLTYPQRRRKAVGKGPPRIVFAIFVESIKLTMRPSFGSPLVSTSTVHRCRSDAGMVSTQRDVSR